MLKKIIIKNVALIESAEIEFSSGLNVLSGETGSGKSVIMESINFVLGAKADKSLIKSGESECSVTAEFDIENVLGAKQALSDIGFDEDDVLILSRKMSDNGKSVVKINGNSATVGMLKKLTSVLVDVHGQSEHFTLLDENNQLKLIDNFGGDEIKDIKEQVKSRYESLKNMIKELNSNGGDERDRLIRLDVLNYQINEIENAQIKENELEELSDLKIQLVNREKIVSALSAVKSCISDEGALDSLSGAVRTVGQIANLNGNYQSLTDRLNSVYSELDDISETACGLSEEFEDYGYTLSEVEDRLYKIKNRNTAEITIR